MDEEKPLHLFEGYGIELEYMIVQKDTLDILPISDKILPTDTGDYFPDPPLDNIAWSNELVLHVLEFKNNGPAPELEPLPRYFSQNIEHAVQKLSPFEAKLMPTAMHPWMNPLTETHLWPYSYSEVYKAYDQIFNCKGHGWSNLQSIHVNLPFGNEEEFGRLHAALRIILPILPALAASSPIVEQRITGWLDTRMEIYRHNQKRVPQIIGQIIPERVFTFEDYLHEILEKSYLAISPYDPHAILQHEWLNSRGVTARFSRNAFEIRVLDVQECPLCDIAIVAAIVAVVKKLVEEHWIPWSSQKRIPTEPLSQLFLQHIKTADTTSLPEDYVSLFGQRKSIHTSGQLWQSLIEDVLSDTPIWQYPLDVILRQGPLSRRILKAVGQDTSRAHLAYIYEQLCKCLINNQPFVSL